MIFERIINDSYNLWDIIYILYFIFIESYQLYSELLVEYYKLYRNKFINKPTDRKSDANVALLID